MRIVQGRRDAAAAAARRALWAGDAAGRVVLAAVELARGDERAALEHLGAARAAGVDLTAWRDDAFLRPYRSPELDRALGRRSQAAHRIADERRPATERRLASGSSRSRPPCATCGVLLEIESLDPRLRARADVPASASPP